MTAGRKKTAKPAKKATTKRAAKQPPAKKPAAKKATPTQAPVRVKVPKRTLPTGADPHSELLEGDPDKHLVDGAEKGREAAELRELSDDVVKAYGKLTAREHAFIEAYLELRQATPAAERAGYSKAYAHTHAGRLLNKPSIRAIITEIDRVNLDALQITDGALIKLMWQEANFAFEGPTRVNAIKTLMELRDMFPAKKVKHGLIDPALESLSRGLDEIDGAGTGLPKPGARQPWTASALMAQASVPRTRPASTSW